MAEKEKIVFLSGKKINLRPLDAETDLSKAVKWINDQEVSEFLLRFLPMTRNEEKEWFNKKQTDSVALAIETKKGLYIGNIGLHKIDHLNGTAEIGIMIGEKNYWGRGFGFDAEMTLLNYGFNTLNLRKIEHRAESRNKKKSPRCHESSIGGKRRLGRGQRWVGRGRDNGAAILAKSQEIKTRNVFIRASRQKLKIFLGGTRIFGVECCQSGIGPDKELSLLFFFWLQ